MVPLLPESELYRLFEGYRERFFYDAPDFPRTAEVTIEWSSRLTASAGICYPRQRLIRLSTHYHQAYPGEVGGTLLHEMIHLVVHGHGPAFHAWIERIRERGGRVDRYAKARAKPRSSPRWVYRCVQCGARIQRYRRLAGGGRHHRHKRCGGRLAEARWEDA